MKLGNLLVSFWRDERSRLVSRRNLPFVGIGLCIFPVCEAKCFLTNVLRSAIPAFSQSGET